MTAVESDLLYAVRKPESPRPLARPGRYVAFEGDAADPDPILLYKNEVLITKTPIEIRASVPMTPIEALMKVSGASTLDEIGHKPIAAAANTSENAGNPELELFDNTEFARDEIFVARGLRYKFPKIARTTIFSLAHSQGGDVNEAREETIGKILHENRKPDDPIAKKITETSGWGWPYRGAIDVDPQYIELVDEEVQENGREILSETYTDVHGREQKIIHAVTLAANVVIDNIDSSPGGLLEYKQGIPRGIENKVWRDSKESYHHKDGTLADNTYGIASFSAQVDAYKALQGMSRIFPDEGDVFTRKAEKLKEKILEQFWKEDEKGGYFVIGLERQKDDLYKPLDIRTSDMGHVLDSDILEGDDPEIVRKREMLVKSLFSSDMYVPSGIVTLGRDEVRHNPGGYHNGSVWMRENYKIAKGLERHGYFELARLLHQANINIRDVTTYYPEKVLGDASPLPRMSTRIVEADDGKRRYKPEQPGQLIQAWSVQSVIAAEDYMEWYKREFKAA